MSRRLKLLFLVRLIPLAERNYNLVELGPRGTGKSYVVQEVSPYSALLTGGTTAANLFGHMSGRQKGMVQIWDVVGFDEVADLQKMPKEVITTMKTYCESGTFQRGQEAVSGDASIAMFGNTNQPVDVMVQTGHLFAPMGYWAKLAHGKTVVRPPLPPLPKGQTDHIALRPHAKESLPPEVAAAQHLAAQEEADAKGRIVVPTERPPKLHPIAAATEKALRKAKPDDEGFIASEGAGTVSVRIGLTSLERVVRLLHALLQATQDRGHGLSAEGSVCIIADEQPLAVRIYETKDKATHVPTAAELKRQAEQDDRRARYPSIYRSDHKIYRAWDYFPSGRLALELSDPKQRGWKADPIFGRWYDRSRRRVEDCLAEIMAALKMGGALARHQRAQEAEEARIAKEAEDRRSQQEIQRRLLARVTAFLVEEADQHAQLMKLENLATFLQSAANRPGGQQHAELQAALEFALVNLRNQLSADAVNEEIVRGRLLEPGYW